MANLTSWLLEEAASETIEAVVIGEMGWGNYGSDAVPNYNDQPRGKVLSWEDARTFLDYDFYDGYGAPRCNAVYAWTLSKVMFIVQYDGSTWLNSVPRHPMEGVPSMPGG